MHKEPKNLGNSKLFCRITIFHVLVIGRRAYCAGFERVLGGLFYIGFYKRCTGTGEKERIVRDSVLSGSVLTKFYCICIFLQNMSCTIALIFFLKLLIKSIVNMTCVLIILNLLGRWMYK